MDKLSSLEVAAGELGCRLSFVSWTDAAIPAVIQLPSNAVITGEHGVAGRRQQQQHGAAML